jgi:hypothetical protein
VTGRGARSWVIGAALWSACGTDSAVDASDTSTGTAASSESSSTITADASTTEGGTSSGADSTSAASTGASSTTTGGAPELGDPFTSGTRLRARYLDGGDNQAFVDWYDTELAHSCSFIRDDEGTMRCMPGSVAGLGSVNAAQPRAYFLDADCSQPVVTLGACTDLEYVVVPTASSPVCGPTSPRTSWSVGADVGTPADLYESVFGGCTPVDFAPAGALVSLAPVDASMLVAAEIEHIAIDDEIGMEVLVGADGSAQWLAAIDVARDHACIAAVLDMPRCVSTWSATVSGSLFEDSGCANPWVGAMRGGPDCAPPDFVSIMGSRYEVGAEADPADVYSTLDDGCDPVPEDLPFRYHRAGAVLDPGVFPAIGERVEGEGRLRLHRDTTIGGERLLPRHRWDDTEIALECRAARVDASTSVCLPNLVVGRLWADDACTVPVAHVQFVEPEEITMLTAIAETATDASCNSAFVAGRAVVGPHDGPLYSDRLGCELAPRAPGDAYVLLGAEVGPEAFPALPLVTE